MIFPNPSQAIQNALTSENSIQNFIDGKLPFGKASPKEVYFFAEYSDVEDSGRGLLKNFDVVRNTTEDWTVNITKSPVENGDQMVEHISKPSHTINLTGVVSQIQFEWYSAQDFVEGQARAVISRAGQFAPSVASPVANKVNEGLVKINKIKARAESILADARGFYAMAKQLKGEDQDIVKRYVVLKEALALAMFQKQTFTVGVHGNEYNNYALTKFSINQNSSTIYTAELQLTFEYIPRVSVAKTLDVNIAKITKAEVKKYEAEALKKSVGETKSVISRIF